MSPFTPVAFVFGSIAKYCHRFLCRLCFSIVSLSILSAFRSSCIFSLVIGPSIRTASPGPGIGFFSMSSLGNPWFWAILRTSSLYRFLSGSTMWRSVTVSPPTLWCVFILSAPLLAPDSIMSG